MNRLGTEASPYLRQHANNPVHWQPWGAEALEQATRENKPILLSVGYSACHWCHVMAHESFENPEVARVMNEHFINIKVDREERPDVDQLYQGVVQLMGKGGGWPLTVFLTPTLRPFYGGTYFPPQGRHGLPGFAGLVEGLGVAWRDRREEVDEQAKLFEDGLTEMSSLALGSTTSGAWTKADLITAGDALTSRIDPTFGGFGLGGPKLPNPMNLAFMLRAWKRSGSRKTLDGVFLTLEKMALGGIHDQLGGGFHRYSVDERWLVPHFEKMLYDTAQLIHLYAEAWLIEPRPLWKQTVERAVEWVQREMTSPEGPFFAAQDADTEGEEGRFFVWTPAQIDAALGADDGAFMRGQLGVTDEGTFEHGSSVLARKTMPADAERFDRLRVKLFEARTQRTAPGLDDKRLAGWNGLMIRGLAFASRVFERPDWAQLATAATNFIASRYLRADDRLKRTPTQPEGMLEDVGDLASGLVALYQATFDAGHLALAERLIDAAVRDFWDDEKKAWLAAPKGTPGLFVPTFALHDNAFPSGASTVTEAQLVLAALTGRTRHLDHASRYLERMKDEMSKNPLAFGHLLIAADLLVDGAADVALVGTDAVVAPLLAAFNRRFSPTVSVLVKRDGDEVPEVLREQLEGRPGAGAFFCQHFACQRPVTEPAALLAMLP